MRAGAGDISSSWAIVVAETGNVNSGNSGVWSSLYTEAVESCVHVV